VPFEDIRSIRSAFGGTVNDVVLTIVLNGFQQLLTSRSLPVRGKSLLVMVPVALRDRDEHGRPIGDGTMETKASALMAKLPLDIDDPVARLQIVQENLAALKQTSQAEALTTVNELTTLLPGTVTSVLLRGMSRRPQRSLQTTVTNVHGPTVPLYVLGREISLIGNYAPPFPVGARTSVTVYSYEGQLVFGVTGDEDSIPDVDLITRGIADGATALLAAAAEKSAPAARPARKPRATSNPSSG
jgi:diacylglycerol O-acyltransferase / wax synthase